MRPRRRPFARGIPLPPLPPEPRPRLPRLPSLPRRRPFVACIPPPVPRPPLPQLLGIFLNIHDPALPVFAPTRRRSDLDHAAAIRGADVFFTLLPEDDKDPDPDWTIDDCRDGYVILVNYQTKQVAVYDPLTRALDLFPMPPDEVCSDMYVEFHMLASECPRQYRVVSVAHDVWGAQAAVFSSDTKECQVFPFSEDASQPDDGLGGTMVNGFVYWTFASGSNIRVLNTATLQFSQMNPPLHMEGQGEFKPSETKDGKLCLVCAVKLTLVVWIWRPDDDGVDRWILDKSFSLQGHPDGLDGDIALNIVAIISGFVYFSTFSEMNPDSCLFMSFCLETGKLNKLCPVSHSYHSHPYIMAFPPSLLCNKEGEPSI